MLSPFRKNSKFLQMNYYTFIFLKLTTILTWLQKIFDQPWNALIFNIIISNNESLEDTLQHHSIVINEVSTLIILGIVLRKSLFPISIIIDTTLIKVLGSFSDRLQETPFCEKLTIKSRTHPVFMFLIKMVPNLRQWLPTQRTW